MPVVWLGMDRTGLEITKRAGWHASYAHESSERAARLWLAVAVATLWLLSGW